MFDMGFCGWFYFLSFFYILAGMLYTYFSYYTGMGQYVTAVREHITTGNALLAISDSDMDKKLGVANPLHRRKLRLAIEEQRRPDRLASREREGERERE